MIKIYEVIGVLRNRYIPRKSGKTWVSFLGSPYINYELIPNFKDINISFKANTDIFNISEKILENALEKTIFPEFVSIGIPLTKKNRKKFKNN